MAGYSGTPLSKKLGIREGFRIYVKGPPDEYEKLLEPLPAGVCLLPRAVDNLDMVHFFTGSRAELLSGLKSCLPRIKQAGMIWVSWPKKSSGVRSDVTEDVIREVALPMGLVDIKVCAVSDIWSGLKLVIRKENRV